MIDYIDPTPHYSDKEVDGLTLQAKLNERQRIINLINSMRFQPSNSGIIKDEKLAYLVNADRLIKAIIE